MQSALSKFSKRSLTLNREVKKICNFKDKNKIQKLNKYH